MKLSVGSTMVAIVVGLMTNRVAATVPQCTREVESTFQIYTVKQAKAMCKLHKNLVKKLREYGFEKVMCPFGVLVIADAKYPDELLKYGANIVANLLDSDNDGEVDDMQVANHLAHNGKFSKGAALNCGSTREQEEQGDMGLSEVLDYTFSCQTYKGESEDEYRAIMFEEAFHMVHQNGWARRFPDIFGMDAYDGSVLCRETASHTCTNPGWVHPENECPIGAPFPPGSPAEVPLEGSCNEPSCDCAEFYRQASTLYMDWKSENFWYSEYMPSNKNDFEAMVSTEFLEVMSNPIYNQPQSPLSGVYTFKVRGTKGWGTGASCADKRKFKLGGEIKTCGFVAKRKKKLCKRYRPRMSCPKTCGTCECSKYPNGEEVCEGHGYTKEQCLLIGDDCCGWDDEESECHSNIGTDSCFGIPTGEEACEEQGYNKEQCLQIGDGCCHWNDWEFEEGVCFSEIGEDFCVIGLPNGEEACEEKGYNKEECLAVGCCHWNDSEFEEGVCFSDISDKICFPKVPLSTSSEGF